MGDFKRVYTFQFGPEFSREKRGDRETFPANIHEARRILATDYLAYLSKTEHRDDPDITDSREYRIGPVLVVDNYRDPESISMRISFLEDKMDAIEIARHLGLALTE